MKIDFNTNMIKANQAAFCGPIKNDSIWQVKTKAAIPKEIERGINKINDLIFSNRLKDIKPKVNKQVKRKINFIIGNTAY